LIITPQDRASEITLQDWERRKSFVNFTDADAQSLRELRPHAEAYAGEVVDALYVQFLKFEEIRTFLRDEATLNRVKASQKAYFLALTQGDYGKGYLENRLHIGRVHHRIGLTPRWYLGAYSIYLQLTVPKIMEAFAGNLERAQRSILALIKIIDLDRELAITTYITAAEEVITRQSREILELSTPIIRLWEGVVAAPLIGTLDTARAQQFTENLLESIVKTRSTVALIDITGVPSVDTRTAQHLIETVSAVRLLGADIILTGIRPAIAQTLVHLGIDLSSVNTRSSLADGLRLALEKLQKPPTDRKTIVNTPRLPIAPQRNEYSYPEIGIAPHLRPCCFSHQSARSVAGNSCN